MVVGDGIRNPAGKECDDGNITATDGCDWNCTLAPSPSSYPAWGLLVPLAVLRRRRQVCKRFSLTNLCEQWTSEA